MPGYGISVFSPGSFQFWSNTQLRPKKAYEGYLVFPDLVFGGDGMRQLEPHLLKTFSRPGYSSIETQTAEYQLRTGDYAQIDYPTHAFKTKPLSVTLIDVGDTNQGANTAGAIETSLTMTQKGMEFEHIAAGKSEETDDSKYNSIIKAASRGVYPDMFFILETNPQGESLGMWEIWNPLLTSVEHSDINYSANELATITLTFTYKNFKYSQRWAEKFLRDKLAAVDDDTPITDWLDGLAKDINETTSYVHAKGSEDPYSLGKPGSVRFNP